MDRRLTSAVTGCTRRASTRLFQSPMNLVFVTSKEQTMGGLRFFGMDNG